MRFDPTMRPAAPSAPGYTRHADPAAQSAGEGYGGRRFPAQGNIAPPGLHLGGAGQMTPAGLPPGGFPQFQTQPPQTFTPQLPPMHTGGYQAPQQFSGRPQFQNPNSGIVPPNLQPGGDLRAFYASQVHPRFRYGAGY